MCCQREGVLGAGLVVLEPLALGSSLVGLVSVQHRFPWAYWILAVEREARKR